MRLASMFLETLDGNFDTCNIERAFYKTNQLFLSKKKVDDEDILDLLDVCQEFFPQTFLIENEDYQQLWSRLENAYHHE